MKDEVFGLVVDVKGSKLLCYLSLERWKLLWNTVDIGEKEGSAIYLFLLDAILSLQDQQ